MSEIAKYLQFNVTFKLVDDEKYGSKNEHGRWNGMINEVRAVCFREIVPRGGPPLRVIYTKSVLDFCHFL